MVTVPAKSKAKGSNMVNLQLKNPVTLKQDNVTGKFLKQNVSYSVQVIPGSWG